MEILTRIPIRVTLFSGGVVKAYSSREIIALLRRNGWQLVRVSGSHHQFRHPERRGLVTVPHPRKILPLRTVKSILKQAGLETSENE